MADRRILADTSLFIEHLRSRSKTSTSLYRLASRAQVETSAIVAAEIFYGARDAEKEHQAWSVLRPFSVHSFTLEMASRLSSLLSALLKKNRMIDLRDLMHAATALELGLRLATLNRSHFEVVPGLELEDLSDPSALPT